jgi:hypothetical protein
MDIIESCQALVTVIKEDPRVNPTGGLTRIGELGKSHWFLSGSWGCGGAGRNPLQILDSAGWGWNSDRFTHRLTRVLRRSGQT